METLSQFETRIEAFQTHSVPDEPTFGLPPSLEEKVAPQAGALQSFYGDTVAYFLDDQARDLVARIGDRLHTHFGESLSVRLPADAAHVTLHDLHAGPQRARVWPKVEAHAAAAGELVAQARAFGPIRTACTAVFNMMNTSVVIGVKATDEHEHRKLLTARALFDHIVPSGPFTPHITLAYYRPAPPTALPPAEFRAALSALTADAAGTSVLLAPERLHLLHFSSMGDYRIADEL